MAQGELITDVCIVGAGPAGITASLKLSQAGISFILIEKENFPRNKVCGDGLSGNALMAIKRIDPILSTALHESGLGNPSWGTRFISPNLKSVLVGFGKEELPYPPGYVIRRRDLDAFLLNHLKKLNPDAVLEGTEVISATRKDGRVVLETAGDKNTISCNLLLVATGTILVAFRDVIPDLPPAISQGLGIRAYFENISGFGKDNAIEIHFLKELLPCYLWIFPLGNGAANVGLALPTDRVREEKIVLKDLLAKLLEKYSYLKARFSKAEMQGKVEAYRLAFYHGKIPVSADNVMLLGDAARLVDPFTGEGIGNAMVSGLVAADVAKNVIGPGDFSLKKLSEYDRSLYEKLGKDLALGLRLRDLAVNKRLINLVVGKASRSSKTREALRDVIFGLGSMKELGKPMFFAKLVLGLE
jgi:menaquinone-9 beta-reductase